MSEEDREGKPPYHDLAALYRRQQGLGDLPRPIAEERGERYVRDAQGVTQPGSVPGSPSQVADVVGRQQEIKRYVETHDVSKRAPPLLFEVQSTYDSRPVQGSDFHASACAEIEFEDTPTTFDPVRVDFLVPDNKIAVLRKFRYTVSPTPIGLVTEGICWLQSDLFIEDSIVRDYNGMVLPVAMDRPFDTFVIVDERDTISLVLSKVSATVLSTDFIGEILGVQFELYGNLILKTGIPKEFQIANAIAGRAF